MCAQEEQAVRETKRRRRANQRRVAHSQITIPATAEEVSRQSDNEQTEKQIPNIKPFDELEELS